MSPSQPKTIAALGTTTLDFEVIDLRGARGSRTTTGGLVYVHDEDRLLPESKPES